MNEITRKIVIETAKKNKAKAKKSMQPDSDFHWLVYNEWWNHMIDIHGVRLKIRFQQLLDVFYPGWCDDFVDYDLDITVSNRIVNMIDRIIERNPEYQLCKDYGDLAVRTVEPQLSLF